MAVVQQIQQKVYKTTSSAKLSEEEYAKNEKVVLKKGMQVGNFLFVQYNKYKNRATYECQECGRKFTSNIYSIKNKKRCKWYKFHDKKFK